MNSLSKRGEATAYPDRLPVATATCSFRRSSEWFCENISPDVVVYLKLNCEGCEVAILLDLLESGEYGKDAAGFSRLRAL
jgi:hypothetical protein